MVNTVSSNQYSELRIFAERPELLRFLAMALKQFCFLFVILNTEHWILSAAKAKDFGTHGVIYPIEEEDPVVLIQQKLKGMEERGELKRHNIELQQKTKSAIERPKPVEGITRASETRVFYFDPSYTVPEDLKDQMGRVFAKKGTKINPLETVSLSQSLLFFDGDDVQQKEYAQQQFIIEKGKIKLILIRGAPLALSEEWDIPVYFDQGGLLTKKLGIYHIPAVVTQEGLSLRIEEVQLDEKPYMKDSLAKNSTSAEEDK